MTLRSDPVTATGEVLGAGVGDTKAKITNGAQQLEVEAAKAFGDGKQSLQVTLDAKSVQVLVQSAPGSTLTLGLGASVRLLALALWVGVVALLVLMGLFLLRRRRVPRILGGSSSPSTEHHDADGPSAPAPSEPVVSAQESLLVGGRVARVADERAWWC